MTRRDTIIIATLVNAGLLACLFVTATRQEEISQEMAVRVPITANVSESYDLADANEPKEDNHFIADEVDQALKEFLPDDVYAENEETVKEPEEKPKETPAPAFVAFKELKPLTPAASTNVTNLLKPSNQKVVEVTVKKGDMLEKIARANGTTVNAIKEASALSSDKLRVGQVLKVPVGTVALDDAPKPKEQVAPLNDNTSTYTVQSGDNPWKIAKKFHVKFEDILRLNNMTEEKAKNLKVGQEIRVR